MKKDDFNFEILDRHPKDAIKFFKMMMRLEYSLKEYRYARRKGSTVEVTWDEFAKKLGKDFFRRIKNSGILKQLLEHPPKRQTLEDNRLLWESVTEISNVQELLGAVRRVRNNLFHGGKHGDPDSERNDDLISDCITVIEKILENDDVLNTIFSGRKY